MNLASDFEPESVLICVHLWLFNRPNFVVAC